jgi:hypothetical protein
MKLIISTTSGNIVGNHFPKILSVLSSHCSGCFHVMQNETLSMRFLD